MLPKMNGPVEITERDRELLVSVVQTWSPELQALLSAVGHRRLKTSERERLRGALADELVATGLDDDDEPTAYGVELDDLIGRLMFF
jgi:hypothetical protein